MLLTTTRNPIIITSQGGSSSAVERQLPKLDVAGSIPVSRSIVFNYFHNPEWYWNRPRQLAKGYRLAARNCLGERSSSTTACPKDSWRTIAFPSHGRHFERNLITAVCGRPRTMHEDIVPRGHFEYSETCLNVQG